MCFSCFGTDCCYGERIAGHTDDHRIGCDDLLPGRKRDPDLVISHREYLVKRCDDAIDHGFDGWIVQRFGQQRDLCICSFGTDCGYRKRIAGHTDDHRLRCDDLLPGRKRDFDLVFGYRKHLVERCDHAIDHGFDSRFLQRFGQQRNLCFSCFGTDSSYGKRIASHANDQRIRRYDFLYRRKCYFDLFIGHREHLVERCDHAIGHGFNGRIVQCFGQQWDLCICIFGTDCGYRKRFAGNTDDNGIGCDDLLPGRKRDFDFFISHREHLVERCDHAIDHGFN